MSGCHSQYGYSGRDECSRNHSASIFYFISTIAAMVVLGSITVLFFCCIYYKRRRIAERLRNARSRGQHPGPDPVVYVWRGAAAGAQESGSGAGPGATDGQTQANQTAPAQGNVAKGTVAGAEPVSCVIMAGEERPTHLARPLPREEFVDVSLDSKFDELEQGKRRQT